MIARIDFKWAAPVVESQTWISYGHVRSPSTVGLLGLRVGVSQIWTLYNRRQNGLPCVPGLWGLAAASMVLGLQCLYLDSISVRVSDSAANTALLVCLLSHSSSVFVSAVCSVNYIYLFDFDPRIVNSPLGIFNDAVDNTLFFLWCMLVYYKVHSRSPVAVCEGRSSNRFLFLSRLVHMTSPMLCPPVSILLSWSSTRSTN
jgi:hypothetical protein